MKRTLLLLVAIVAFGWQGNAQQISDHVIGLRFGGNDGMGPEINYQHALHSNNRLEVGLGWYSRTHFSSTKLTGIYQWVWHLQDGFNWYAGPGGGIGFSSYKTGYYSDPTRGNESNTYILLTGDVGIEYLFDFPLTISLDVRPQINFGNNDNLNLDVGISARYRF